MPISTVRRCSRPEITSPFDFFHHGLGGWPVKVFFHLLALEIYSIFSFRLDFQIKGNNLMTFWGH
jgi:hypothetical protein